MITGNKPALFRFMGHFADHIKEMIIWDKTKAQPAIRDGCLNSGYEIILVIGDNPISRRFESAPFARGTLDNIFRIPTEAGKIDDHRATFPIQLTDTILKNFSLPGQSVFDPFLGSGTTAISAHYAGLDFTGCELSPGYFKSAQERIDLENSQLDMF